MPAFEIQLLDADGEAFAYARKLLAERPRYSTVLITEGDRELGKVERGAAQPAAADRSMDAR